MPEIDLQSDPARCGAIAHPDGGVRWRVWAPAARNVELVLIRNDRDREVHTMPAEPDGYFGAAVPAAREGCRYAFRLNRGPERPDPASRWQPDGVHQPSAVLFPERFEWSENHWPGLARERLVIYELHVGTFTPQGTFDGIVPRLSHLRELGITAIELMPVAQFSGTRNWGYDGVHPYAVQNSYGGPHGLARLINACHRAGIGVIADVVYNHLGPEGNYFSEFGPYFTDRYHTPWGRALNFDDCGCDAVRAFVLHNVRYWIREFRVDGLRLDAVHAIFDASPRHILREIKEAAVDESRRAGLGRPVHIIAESNLNDVRLLDPIDRGGYGLDAQWSDDFHHTVHALLTGERLGYYADFGRPEQLVKALTQTFVYDGCDSAFRGRRHGASAGEHAGDRFVVSIQTHDQVGNRAAADRLGTLLTPAQQRLAAGLLLLAPHIPLLFMGEEYGETRPFPFFCSFSDRRLIDAVRRGRRAEFAAFHGSETMADPQSEDSFRAAVLSWDWPEGSSQAGLRRLYQDLLAARIHWPALHDFRNRSATLLDDSRVLQLTRGDAAPDHAVKLVAYFNLTEQPQPLAHDSYDGTELILSSELPRYTGCRSRRTASSRGGSDGTAPADLASDPLQQPEYLAPYEFRIFGRESWRLP